MQVEIDFWRAVNPFCAEYRDKLGPDFPALETCDVIVRDGLSAAWAKIARENRWGDRFAKGCYVRVVDRETGEWIDAATAGAYEDWIYTDHGAKKDFDEEDRDSIGEDKEERDEKMMAAMRYPLPRIAVPLFLTDIACPMSPLFPHTSCPCRRPTGTDTLSLSLPSPPSQPRHSRPLKLLLNLFQQTLNRQHIDRHAGQTLGHNNTLLERRPTPCRNFK